MAEIRFRDDAGWQWEVVEHRSRKQRSIDDSVPRLRALYFLSRYQTRRCDDFPADWAKRSPRDLMELWADAKPL
jgi:hypothetical protein